MTARANKSKWPAEDDECPTCGHENPAGYGVKPDKKVPKTLTYGKLPPFKAFMNAFDDVTAPATVYAIKLGRTDAKAAEGTIIAEEGNFSTVELHDGLKQLIKKWNRGNEAAGDLASGILQTLGFEWV